MTTIQLTCQYEHEAWGPNEGCREWMTEPEVWLCGKPAAFLHVGVARWLVASEDEDGNVEPVGTVTAETTAYCAEHSAEVEATDREYALMMPCKVLHHHLIALTLTPTE